MLNAGTPVFVMIHDEDPDDRALHPGTVVQDNHDTCTIEFHEEILIVLAGQSCTVLYYEDGLSFRQRSASVDAVMDSGTPIVTLRATGNAESAESRQSFRVSTILAPITARVGQEEGCRVLDISATGFSIQTDQQYATGLSLQAEIEFDGKTFSGPVQVQGLRPLPHGGNRCGLRCDGRGAAENLEKALQHITMTIQRRQLRRMRGTG